MANSLIKVAEPAIADKNVDTEQLTVGGNTVERERVQLAGVADVAVVTVGNTDPATNAYGLTVRAIPSATATPVSGPLTDAQLAARLPLSVTGPLTDTQLRAAVVPVGDGAGSLTVDAPVATPVFSRLSDGAAALIGQKAMTASLPVVLASDQSSIPVVATPITLTKSTQGATGFSVQDLRDAGRVIRVFMLDTITVAPVADALATVVQWYNNAAVAGTTQPAVVPAGKILRLTTWKIQYQSLATVGYAVVRVRINTGGLVVIGSPLAFSFEAGSGSGATTAAMTGGVTTETGEFPEGFEIPAGAGIGFSVAGYGPTGTLTAEGGVRFMVAGYEY